MDPKPDKRYTGLIKWFRDEARDANYGFIQHIEFGDIFFHERNVEKGQVLSAFTENRAVTFAIKPSKAHTDKYEAVEVQLLITEQDQSFLLQNFLDNVMSRGVYGDYTALQKVLLERIVLLNSIIDATIRQNLFRQYIFFLIENSSRENTSDTKAFLEGMLKIGRDIFKQYYPSILAELYAVIPEGIIYDLWLNAYLPECPIDHAASILTQVNEAQQRAILTRCVIEERNNILFKVALNYEQRPSECDFENCCALLKLAQEFIPDKLEELFRIIEAALSQEVHCEIWLRKLTDKCPVSYLVTVILQKDISWQGTIFQRCTEVESIEILTLVAQNIIDEKTWNQGEPILLLDLTKRYISKHYDRIIDIIAVCIPPYIKLDLWLRNYYNVLDFDQYKPYIFTLPANEQKTFIKKALSYKVSGQVELSVDDILSLNVTDYGISKVVKKIDGQHVDYSTSIILNTVSALRQQVRFETRASTKEVERSLYDIILSQLRNPNDILEVTGYFDQCEGRCSVRKHVHQDNEGNIISVDREYIRYKVPNRHLVCDGRKAVDAETSETVLDELTNEKFWWCANQKCFQASRRLHKVEEWEKYTLIDILEIFGINYRPKELEIYLSLINKVNRFLKHMKCRGCKQILRPVRQSNYAFYGVNDFHCTNEGCLRHGEVIYLTHCLNGKCEQIIDSRDSVRCKPAEHDSEQCGWYVCNYCYSCCSDDVINRRKYILQKTGQDHKCHHNGHRGRNVCCNKCGFPMKTDTFDELEYNKALSWFIGQSQLKMSKYVVSSGRNKAGKWWFRFSRAGLEQTEFKKKLLKLERLGFNIPNVAEERSIQLVAEPYKVKRHGSDMLFCEICSTKVDLSEDFERAAAIKYFHGVFFTGKGHTVHTG